MTEPLKLTDDQRQEYARDLAKGPSGPRYANAEYELREIFGLEPDFSPVTPETLAKVGARRVADTAALAAMMAAKPAKPKAAPRTAPSPAPTTPATPKKKREKVEAAPAPVVPITALDDARLGNLSSVVIGILANGAPTDKSAGHTDQKVMGELKNNCGLPLENVKQVWRLSPLSKDSAQWPRPFDDEIERLWANTPLDESNFDLRRMNVKHAVLPITGKARVVTFGEEKEFPGRTTIVMVQSFEDFAAIQNKYSHAWIDKDGKPQVTPLGTWWLNSPNRRQYDNGQAFMPYSDEKECEGKLNLWHGFGVTPKKGDCSLFLDFERNVVCSGDAE
jgi:hypothetical protein